MAVGIPGDILGSEGDAAQGTMGIGDIFLLVLLLVQDVDYGVPVGNNPVIEVVIGAGS
jgi:hypothetical protein